MFDLGQGAVTWRLAKVGGQYGAGDRSMRFVALRDDGPFAEAITTTHPSAEVLLGGECRSVSSGASVPLSGECVELQFDMSAAETHLVLQTESAGRFVIFTEHFPTEFHAQGLGTPMATMLHTDIHSPTATPSEYPAMSPTTPVSCSSLKQDYETSLCGKCGTGKISTDIGNRLQL